MTLPGPVPALPPFYGFTRLTATGLVTAGPAFIMGMLITPDGAACDVGLYNGEDDSSFGLFHTFHTGVSTTFRHDCSYPIYFNRGIYVTLDEHAQEVTVKWSPVPAELGEPQSPFPDVPEPSP